MTLRTLLLCGAVASLWFTAYAIEVATRLMAGPYANYGPDLPGLTLATFAAVRSHATWVVALVASALLVFLWSRRQEYFLHACVAVAFVSTFAASLAVIALALPTMNCGFTWPWPEWPASPSSGAGCGR